MGLSHPLLSEVSITPGMGVGVPVPAKATCRVWQGRSHHEETPVLIEAPQRGGRAEATLEGCLQGQAGWVEQVHSGVPSSVSKVDGGCQKWLLQASIQLY